MATPKDNQAFQALTHLEHEAGFLTAPAVVNRARDITSPLHDYFEWDDGEAGEKYRLHQARLLINSYTVEVQGANVQRWFNVRVETEKLPAFRAYFNAERVLSDDALYQQVVDRLLGEIDNLKRRYGTLEEVRHLFNETVVDELKRKKQ